MEKNPSYPHEHATCNTLRSTSDRWNVSLIRKFSRFAEVEKNMSSDQSSISWKQKCCESQIYRITVSIQMHTYDIH